MIKNNFEINKIYCGDNVSIMKEMPNELIDLTITSPPYGYGKSAIRNYNGYEFNFIAVARELYRVTKQGGVVVWIVNDVTENGSESGDSFRQALYFKDVGFNLHDTMIYEKSGCRYPEINRYYPIFEFMFILSKGKPKTYNLIKDRKNIYAGSKVARKNSIRTKDGKLIENSAWRIDKDRKLEEYGVRYNIWRYSIGKGNHSKDEETFKHPASFPEELVRDHLISWSQEKDTILDPFFGSGTVGKIAILNNRNWIGIDISEEYCQLAQKRINKYLPKIYDE